MPAISPRTYGADFLNPLPQDAVHTRRLEHFTVELVRTPYARKGNPYSESLFKTLKYRPELPLKPFECLLNARRWVTELVHWYNGAHRHSSIGFVTPDQRDAGQDQALLRARAQVYENARQANPLRWSGQVREWSYVRTVHLNPDTPQNKELQTTQKAA